MDEHCPECGNEIYKPYNYCNACDWQKKDKQEKKGKKGKKGKKDKKGKTGRKGKMKVEHKEGYEDNEEDEEFEEWEDLSEEDYEEYEDSEDYEERDVEEDEEEYDEFPNRRKGRPGREKRKDMKPKKKGKKDLKAGLKPMKITCKCGGIIKITSSKRPLKFRCPDCGKSGMLKGTKKKKPEPESQVGMRKPSQKIDKPGRKRGRRREPGRARDYDGKGRKGMGKSRSGEFGKRFEEDGEKEEEENEYEYEDEHYHDHDRDHEGHGPYLEKEKFEDFAGYKIKHRVRKSKKTKSDKGPSNRIESDSELSVEKEHSSRKTPSHAKRRPEAPPDGIKTSKGGKGKRKRPKYEPPKKADVVKPVKGRCTSCGSRNLRFFDDGSGRCADCGRGFSFGGDSSRIQKKEYHCKRCREPLEFIEEYDRWYCYSCNEYA
jgi:predicted RNA-binding Zn-ribbon protein involved in translation (DUF1610 family)